MTFLVASLILATILQAPIPAQRSSPDVVLQARGILTAIVSGNFATAEKQFTDDMKAALPPGALAAMWAKLLNQAGAYKRCGTDPRVRRIDNKEMVITPCEFERTTIDIQFAFDSGGRISGLVFRPTVRTAIRSTTSSSQAPGLACQPSTNSRPRCGGSHPRHRDLDHDVALMDHGSALGHARCGVSAFS